MAQENLRGGRRPDDLRSSETLQPLAIATYPIWIASTRDVGRVGAFPNKLDAKLLVIEQFRPTTGRWEPDLPGGHMQPSDKGNLVNTGVRELREEAGIQRREVISGSQLGRPGHTNPSRERSDYASVFLEIKKTIDPDELNARLDRQRQRRRAPTDRTRVLGWYDPEEVQDWFLDARIRDTFAQGNLEVAKRKQAYEMRLAEFRALTQPDIVMIPVTKDNKFVTKTQRPRNSGRVIESFPQTSILEGETLEEAMTRSLGEIGLKLTPEREPITIGEDFPNQTRLASRRILYVVVYVEDAPELQVDRGGTIFVAHYERYLNEILQVKGAYETAAASHHFMMWLSERRQVHIEVDDNVT